MIERGDAGQSKILTLRASERSAGNDSLSYAIVLRKCPMDPIEEQEESLKRKEKKGDETVLSQFAAAASSTNVITYKAQTNIVPWKCARKPVKNGRERERRKKGRFSFATKRFETRFLV